MLSWFPPQINDYEVQPKKHLKVNISVANVRLFVGNIPKQKSKDEIQEEFGKLTGWSQVTNNTYLCISHHGQLDITAN